LLSEYESITVYTDAPLKVFVVSTCTLYRISLPLASVPVKLRSGVVSEPLEASAGLLSATVGGFCGRKATVVAVHVSAAFVVPPAVIAAGS
jgi:hypothetical protein